MMDGVVLTHAIGHDYKGKSAPVLYCLGNAASF